jgi:hypothetical protein
MSKNPPPRGTAQDAMTRMMIGLQTTQLEAAGLKQRLVELTAQAKTIRQQLGFVERKALSQQKALSSVIRARSREVQRERQRNAMNLKFKQDVQDSFELTEKNRNWRRIKRSIDKKRGRR